MTSMRTRYGVALALLVAGLVLTGLTLRHALTAFPGQPVEFGTSGTVLVDRAALTIFASRPDAAPDSCTVADPAGQPVELTYSKGERIELAGRSWYVLARSAQPAPAAEYAVRCADPGDGTTYAIGRYGSVLGFVLALFALVAAGGFTVAMAVRCARLRAGRTGGDTARVPPPA